MELSREEMIEKVGQKAYDRIEWTIAHPEESKIHRRKRPNK